MTSYDNPTIYTLLPLLGYLKTNLYAFAFDLRHVVLIRLRDFREVRARSSCSEAESGWSKGYCRSPSHAVKSGSVPDHPSTAHPDLYRIRIVPPAYWWGGFASCLIYTHRIWRPSSSSGGENKELFPDYHDVRGFDQRRFRPSFGNRHIIHIPHTTLFNTFPCDHMPMYIWLLQYRMMTFI
jgi:hypothetical protein